MTENYIQYASGYQKGNIDETDIAKAIADVQLMDDEHGAFWVSVITDDENVIEVNKDLTLSLIFEGQKPNIGQKIGRKFQNFMDFIK
jgi:rRNA maturation endonuclease Nob1